ncbi:exodeoxyribonuclease VII/ large subunit [Synechococcus sp. MIT S9220]|uniref:exodeoxyribonuclease VII large subunit n=1 Tax=unclassified Synechococcus TaxID=2626047 RepID=UPI00164AAC05|nr:exodeoxyribonuclease VII large subunit [Synechococcus sp. MIT S9220]NOL45950.1 exodeoxyribonuclease VII large subunit [Synechococcus sp. MIT S9220]QNJ24013.1 exodeoxyribonuclease VII/ large subunit [Synechococcus sp. MIT S9220]
MIANAIPSYSVKELNSAVGSLLERGFAPRFLVQGSASRPQVKKGHLWMNLTDGEATITVVCWASRLNQLDYVPADGDGITVVGKLNFWAARASLAVQAIDIRPSLSTVERRFEAVKALLASEGLIDPAARRQLPLVPTRIALLTSVPSSALADMLRTARERWPLAELLIVPIPVQGSVAPQICAALEQLNQVQPQLKLDALVLARGGGSREDLMVFDDEQVCRAIASFCCPVVTGLGHEDDLTVADLVADHRAATPTAAIVSLFPSRDSALQTVRQQRLQLVQQQQWRFKRERERLRQKHQLLQSVQPQTVLQRSRLQLDQRQQLLKALSPDRWLRRGFAKVMQLNGTVLESVSEAKPNDDLVIQLRDGQIGVTVQSVQANIGSP